MISDFNGGHRNGKKSSGSLFMPLLAFLALFGAPAQGGPLSGSRQLLTLIFQYFQSRRLVWNNKIKKNWRGKHRPKPLKLPYFQP
jgi:hypothetical protein